MGRGGAATHNTRIAPGCGVPGAGARSGSREPGAAMGTYGRTAHWVSAGRKAGAMQHGSTSPCRPVSSVGAWKRRRPGIPPRTMELPAWLMCRWPRQRAAWSGCHAQWQMWGGPPAPLPSSAALAAQARAAWTAAPAAGGRRGRRPRKPGQGVGVGNGHLETCVDDQVRVTCSPARGLGHSRMACEASLRQPTAQPLHLAVVRAGPRGAAGPQLAHQDAKGVHVTLGGSIACTGVRHQTPAL